MTLITQACRQTRFGIAWPSGQPSSSREAIGYRNDGGYRGSIWRNANPFQSLAIDGRSEPSLMTVASLNQHLYEFAVELRRLAYTMPSGHENPLIHLSERMIRCATEQAAEQQQR
jgi:hypothetical protein